MEIRQIAPDDADGVRRLVAVTNAVREADSPWLHPLTEHECVGELAHGWDGEPALGFLATAGGVDVGAGRYEVSSYDNLHLAWLEVEIAPPHRRQGHGSALLDALVARARTEGRTSVGMTGWDAAAPADFAARHGFAQGSVEVQRRLDVDGVPGLMVDPTEDYELVRWPRTTPDADLAALAELTGAINDAPTDDLDVEDEVFTPERIAAYEQAWAARGGLMYRVVARHRRSGALAGQSVVVVDGERPHLVEQHDTSVLAEHRGHRLGLLLKLEVLRWLAAAEPQVREIDTWNAETNDHMIAVNELLGYRVLGRAVDYQRPIAVPPHSSGATSRTVWVSSQ
ncbi:GNAT family N-acetyltransferase [Nocardioides sp. MAH-18]|uniref:GNAT family N-acetyltransferase n=1 Tax=Nocardioides agri TaxID=2682843 RepID=A0A6L6Y2E6_9ACTN|nr:GNAT family N-acetyltransferase [Nocardioides sp. CGMCC 1.13656]MBA2952613.1 GNAT family N-acetyltransferase [Nocardioides sp. CGMCC 1.13656]MVQ51775.1 GNAT family N-acetyltransferase [Nocardioides sp. MAH-18]